MPPPRWPINDDPYMGSFPSQSSSTSLKRPRAASAPCEDEEARLRKRSRADTALDFMDENILEELPDEDPCEFTENSPKSKGKQKESQSFDTHNLPGGVAAAVIEDLAQVFPHLSPLVSHSAHHSLPFQGAKMWMLHRALL